MKKAYTAQESNRKRIIIVVDGCHSGVLCSAVVVSGNDVVGDGGCGDVEHA